MKHTMGLFERPYNSTKSGKKTVEVRLNDEKRRKIKVGDIIEFTKVPEETETLSVQVLKLRIYSTFKEMYEDVPAQAFDAQGRSIDEMVERTYKIYSSEQEMKWGTLAITIKLLDN